MCDVTHSHSSKGNHVHQRIHVKLPPFVYWHTHSEWMIELYIYRFVLQPQGFTISYRHKLTCKFISISRVSCRQREVNIFIDENEPREIFLLLIIKKKKKKKNKKTTVFPLQVERHSRGWKVCRGRSGTS